MSNKIMAALAAFVCFATGGFILFTVRTFGGACLGAGFMLLGLGIAVPAQLHKGVVAVKDEANEVKPIVDDLRKGAPGGN